MGGRLTARLPVVILTVSVVAATAAVSIVVVRSARTQPSGPAFLAPTAGGGGAAATTDPSSLAGPDTGPGVSSIGTTGSFLIVPSLGVDAPVTPAGATGAPGTASLTIPADIHTIGWWDGTVSDGSRTVHTDAPAPGQPGVAVLAGHIDSATAGPGALYDLKDVAVGAVVEIVDSDHHVSKWEVSAPPLVTAKTALPPSLWVTTGPPRLALVTCGGPFDSATGHYLDNVIVWAVPAAS